MIILLNVRHGKKNYNKDTNGTKKKYSGYSKRCCMTSKYFAQINEVLIRLVVQNRLKPATLKSNKELNK